MINDSYYCETTHFNNPHNVYAETYKYEDLSNVCITLDPSSTYAPEYKTLNSVGADLSCIQDVTLQKNVPTLVDTGVSIELPTNIAGLVYIRSSIALSGVILSNGVGVIDPDYRGTIKVILTNISDSLKSFTKGTRIAQLLLTPVIRPKFICVENLSRTVRNTGGFGSTGV
jgi:dUTP pyrophosphatase